MRSNSQLLKLKNINKESVNNSFLSTDEFAITNDRNTDIFNLEEKFHSYSNSKYIGSEKAQTVRAKKLFFHQDT